MLKVRRGTGVGSSTRRGLLLLVLTCACLLNVTQSAGAAQQPPLNPRPDRGSNGEEIAIDQMASPCDREVPVTFHLRRPYKKNKIDLKSHLDPIDNNYKVTINDAEPGIYRLEAACNSDTFADAEFTVMPSPPRVALSISEGLPLDWITVSGFDFDCNGEGDGREGPIDILWDGEPTSVHSAVSPKTPQFEQPFQIPAGSDARKHAISAKCTEDPSQLATADVLVQEPPGKFTFTLTPDHGQATQEVIAHGSEATCDVASLRWDGDDERPVEVRPDATRGFFVALKVPAKASSGRSLQVTGTCGKKTWSQPFSVDAEIPKPVLWVTPEKAAAGRPVSVAGAGFECGPSAGRPGTVEVHWDGGTSPSYHTTGDHRSFTGFTTVPPQAERGPHEVTARCVLDPKSTATVGFTVVPPTLKAVITLEPGAGFGGDVVTVTGSGFDCTPGSSLAGPVEILWDGQIPEAAPTADAAAEGGFGMTFAVPRNSAFSTHTVGAQCADNPDSTATAPFIVLEPPKKEKPKSLTPTLPTPASSAPTSPAPRQSSEGGAGSPTSPSASPPSTSSWPPVTPTDPTSPTPTPTPTLPEQETVTASPASALPGTMVTLRGQRYPENCPEFIPRLGDDPLRLLKAIDAPEPGPGGKGTASVTSIALLPADTKAGQRTVRLTCADMAGKPLADAGAQFKVEKSEDSGEKAAGWWDRPELPKLVPSPDELSFDLRKVATSLLLTVTIMVAIGFPAELINKTYEKNRADIRRMLRMDDRRGERNLGPLPLQFVVYAAIATALVAFAGTDPNLSSDTVLSTIAVFLAVVATTALYGGVGTFYRRGATNEPVPLRLVPTAFVIAGLCALTSRVAHLRPVYLYGLFMTSERLRPPAGMEENGQESAAERERLKAINGRTVLWGSVAMLVAVGVAWVARMPLDHAVDGGSRHPWTVFGDCALASVVVMGIETVLFALIPLNFLDGHDLSRWRPAVWVAVLGFTSIFFSHVLYVSKAAEADDVPFVRMFVLFGVFGAVSILFWGFFTVRAMRGAGLER
ncbi:FGLLP motif-containing membrane protein [Spirillospora sp. NPDC048911]|uniref:FGLLP motif-containing membrane protein n=1 Tax=Spirillospora sp. NPDC048911 TaxID=3364527 RepID=UPI0037141339